MYEYVGPTSVYELSEGLESLKREVVFSESLTVLDPRRKLNRSVNSHARRNDRPSQIHLKFRGICTTYDWRSKEYTRSLARYIIGKTFELQKAKLKKLVYLTSFQ